ncbi:hypothetical protein LTR78_004517 [Recurvomyces mirabilis]|uniref:Alpha/beta hydrolase fold-3 domain-containing protein n=1 Tax=Recurvomyces mirabilis TaxID=574656 RepID=A0AAE0WPL0_9PEZI|nr:hypothetical protein LTR78_004517 [Recurvomyces mirabilis]KAK5152989.1 hypothetical protein LTS14_008097 [Recurvomyces mirabilis]
MLLSASELEKSSQIEPSILKVSYEIYQYAQEDPTPPADWQDAKSIADFMDSVETNAMAQLGPAEATLIEEEHQITMRDGYQSKIKIHHPAEKPASGSPLIVLLYGGGFISGSRHQLTPNARALVRLFNAVVVNIDYRLSPEHKWPVPAHDAWDSLQWIAAHARSDLHADPKRGFLIGGASAGACLSAALTNLSIQLQMSPPLTGQWLAVPSLMEAEHVPFEYNDYFLSREHNKTAPGLDVAALEAIAQHTGASNTSELRFPILFHTNKLIDFAKIPPTFFTVSGMDPLRDDVLIYDEVLKEAGVKTKVDLYYGCPHASWAFMPGEQNTVKALGDINTGFGWLLGKEITREQAMEAYAPSV